MTTVVCNIFFPFYLFTRICKCEKQSHFSGEAQYLSKKTSQTKRDSLQYRVLSSLKSFKHYLSSNTNFSSLLQVSCSNFCLKIVLKALKLQKLSKKSSSFKSLGAKIVTGSQGQNILKNQGFHVKKFSMEKVHYLVFNIF